MGRWGKARVVVCFRNIVGGWMARVRPRETVGGGLGLRYSGRRATARVRHRGM